MLPGAWVSAARPFLKTAEVLKKLPKAVKQPSAKSLLPEALPHNQGPALPNRPVVGVTSIVMFKANGKFVLSRGCRVV